MEKSLDVALNISEVPIGCDIVLLKNALIDSDHNDNNKQNIIE